MRLYTEGQRRYRRVFYGWWIVLGSALNQGLMSLLYYQSFGIYLVSSATNSVGAELPLPALTLLREWRAASWHPSRGGYWTG